MDGPLRGSGMMAVDAGASSAALRRTIDVAFWVTAAALVSVAALAAASSLTRASLWEDEAFNLTVPVNLLGGLGYTSDGTLSGSVLTPFDPRISTGPVVLLPVAAVMALGADLVIGARLVSLVFFAALLAALFVASRRVGGRWAGAAAVAVALAFDASAPPSPIQGPTDVLGEIPAAALLAWAVIAVRRRRWLAGLLVGLAVQAKVISLLAVPAFVVGLLVLRSGQRWGARLRALIVPAALVIAPTVLVELSALLALGAGGYVEHLHMTKTFVLTGGQLGVRTSPGDKLAVLLGAWRLPAPVAGVIAVAAIAAIVVALVVIRHSPPGLDDLLRRADLAPVSEQRATLLIAAVGVAAFAGWWLTAGHTPAWVRHPAPGMLAFVPLVAAYAVVALRVLWS
ncbi:hypothetical protein, partial [Microbacterium sp.]|uniref:hypothetical protein n=1 Tax=Microbacterium sp. TaxID=51671 RepID=UPI003C71E902